MRQANSLKKRLLALLVHVGIVGLGSAIANEDNLSDLSGPYLGQVVPGTEAQLFAPGIVSVTGRYEFALSFAPAGDRVLFTVQTADEEVMVMHARQVNGRWSQPAPVNLANRRFKDEMEAFFHPMAGTYFLHLITRVWMYGSGK